MRERKHSPSVFVVFLAVALFLLLAIPTTSAYANKSYPNSEQETCISCHEDLYFLYDTGKWYCLRDAPMSCSDCHGGDPTAVTQVKAHLQRTVHPIINDDITKCYECHPQQGVERAQMFGDVAGIKPVAVFAAYAPMIIVAEESVLPVTGVMRNSASHRWWIGVVVIALVSMVLIISGIIEAHHRRESHT